MAGLSPPDALQLAAVEEHLRNDEESSVDTKSTDQNSDKATRQLSDTYGGDATPPRLERMNRRTRRRSSCTIPPEDASAATSMSPRLTMDAAPPSAPHCTPRIESKVGMSVLMSESPAGSAANDDTLSLSTDSDLNSDRELEMRAEEIRADLRMQQLIEIAAVAERAAEAGHDSFTGLASTFGGDDGRYMKPLQMKRNNTYTEGQRLLPRPLLRRTHTEKRAKRKVPVMALRHIDDLIPPMEQLHRHLRSHLYRIGVDTENSLVDKSIDPTELEKVTARYQESLSNSHERSFIQRMTRWVASSSMNGEFLEEKKSSGLRDDAWIDLPNKDDSEFDVGSRLCAHITTADVEAGRWKSSPLKFPAGLIPPDEQDFEDNYATPHRMKSAALYRSIPMFRGEDYHETIETPPVLFIQDKSDPSPNSPPNPDPSSDRPRHDVARIAPIALFDDCEEEDDATATHALGSRDHPKPFEITAQSEAPSTPLASMRTPERNAFDGASEENLPSLFITPVRLKGIRDTKTKLTRNHGSAMNWDYSRAGSFTSDPGRISSDGWVITTFGEFATSGGDLQQVGDDYVGGPTSLKPRSESAIQVLDDVNQPTGTSQLAGESTYDARDSSMTELMPSCHRVEESDESQDLGVESKAACDDPANPIQAAGKPAFLLSSRPTEKTEQTPMYGSQSIEISARPTNQGRTSVKLTPRCDSAPVEWMQHGVIVEQAEAEGVSRDLIQNDSTLTPPLANCRNCEFLGLENALSMISDPGLNQHYRRQDLTSGIIPRSSETSSKAVGLRRVTSCPSLIDPWDPEDSDIKRPSTLRRAVDTKQSIMKVFERLSPKSSLRNDRSILFSPKANHEYLNNYLYFSKPSDEIEKGLDPPSRPFCADPCGTKCGDEDGGCYLLTSAADTASFLFKPRSPRRERDFTFETKSSKDYSEFHMGQETWFDAASEKFDGALERLVGSTPSDNDRWRKLFEAPTLNIKTPQSVHKVKRDAKGTNDPRRVKGIILVPQNRARSLVVDVDSTEDQVFVSLYGITRTAFRSLTKEERYALWEKRLEKDEPQESAFVTSAVSPVRQSQKRRAHHRPSFSSTDLALTP